MTISSVFGFNEKTIKIPQPFEIAVNPSTNMIYVANPGNIIVISGFTNEIVSDISTSIPQSNIVVNPNTNRIYFAYKYWNNYMAVIDGSLNKIVTTINITSQGPELAINPSTNMIYAVGGEGDGVTLNAINGSTNTVTNVKVQYGSGLIDVDQRTNRIYLALGNQVDELDGLTYKILDKILFPYSTISALSINPTSKLLYVADFGPPIHEEIPRVCDHAGFVYIVDLKTKDILVNATVKAPTSLSINPNTNRAYVSSKYCDSVTVLNAVTGKVIDVINGTGAVVNPATNKVYVEDLGSGQVNVVDDNQKASGILSPLQQIAKGVLPENVICADSLVLVKRLSDYSPTCIKPLTAQKLVERGWGVLAHNSSIIALEEGEREGPLLIQNIYSDHIVGLNYQTLCKILRIPPEISFSMTLRIGESANDYFGNYDLTLIKIENNKALLLKTAHTPKPCSET